MINLNLSIKKVWLLINLYHQQQCIYPFFALIQGETVLCFHGPLLYEAKVHIYRYLFASFLLSHSFLSHFKCLKAEEKNNQPQYFIHYSGWNKKFVFNFKFFREI